MDLRIKNRPALRVGLVVLASVFLPSRVRAHILVKSSSPSQKWRAFPETSAERFTFRSNVPVQRSLSERDGSHPVVELEKAETTSTSQNSRTTASSPLRYSGPVIRF